MPLQVCVEHLDEQVRQRQAAVALAAHQKRYVFARHNLFSAYRTLEELKVLKIVCIPYL